MSFRGQRRKTATNAELEVRLNAMQRALDGHVNNIRRVAPRTHFRRPWNSCVVQFEHNSAGAEYSFASIDIGTCLVEQLGLVAQNLTKIMIKLRRVDVWSIPTGSSTQRPAAFMDPSCLNVMMGDPVSPGNAEVFYGYNPRISDEGNLSDSAKCSYTWPKNQGNIPITTLCQSTLVATSGNMENTVTYFHILWNTSDVVPPKGPNWERVSELYEASRRKLGLGLPKAEGKVSDPLLTVINDT